MGQMGGGMLLVMIGGMGSGSSFSHCAFAAAVGVGEILAHLNMRPQERTDKGGEGEERGGKLHGSRES